MKFRIWSNEHGAWWKPARNGYTEYTEDAGEYGLDEAAEICIESNRFVKPIFIPNETMVPIL